LIGNVGPMTEELRKTYASMNDDQLLGLLARGALTETAEKLINKELKSRKVDPSTN